MLIDSYMHMTGKTTYTVTDKYTYQPQCANISY